MGMEMNPSTMRSAIAAANVLMTGVCRGWLKPSDCTKLQAPCRMCKPSRIIEKMYQAETYQTLKLETML